MNKFVTEARGYSKVYGTIKFDDETYEKNLLEFIQQHDKSNLDYKSQNRLCWVFIGLITCGHKDAIRGAVENLPPNNLRTKPFMFTAQYFDLLLPLPDDLRDISGEVFREDKSILLDWYEANKDRLTWNAETKLWRLHGE